jgi:hypothetical protein
MTRQKAKYSGLLPVVFVAAIVAVSVVLLSCGTPPPTINLTMYTYPNANNACAQVTISDINSSSQVFFTTDGTTPQLSVGGSTVLYNGTFLLLLPTMPSNTGVVNAIAVAQGYTPSAVISQKFNCPIPEPTIGVAGGGSCPVTVADISEPFNQGGAFSIYYEIGGMGDPSNLSAWTTWTRPFSVSGVTTTIFAVAVLGPSPQNLSPVASFPVNCGPPPTGQYDRVSIIMGTGGDDARTDSEVWATMSGQSGSPFCLKASDGAPASAACAQNGSKLDINTDYASFLPWWANGSSDTSGSVVPNHPNEFVDGTTNKFALPAPQASTAGFGTLDIKLVQHWNGSERADNWNIQGISVIVSDSSGVLPPATLLQMSNPGTGSNCLARLKDSPAATTVRFSLNGSTPPVYVDGNVAGETASCLNNGG